MLPALLGVFGLLALVFGPMLYVRWVMAWHGKERADIPGTGGELARHMLDTAGLQDVRVEMTDAGDHYDPIDRVVRLGPGNLDGRSVTAIAVAAHEVGHALQHRDAMPLFDLRLRLAQQMMWVNRVAMAVMLSALVVGGATQSPRLAILQILTGLGLMVFSVVLQFVTLPLEFDASYRRALPALRDHYIAAEDIPRARSVLRAAALTYVAAAMISVLNLMRSGRIFP